MAILPLSLARVSQTLQTDVATGNINSTEQQLLEVQNELSTGKRVNVPSDDPGASAIIQQLQKTLEQRQSFSSNIQQGNDQLGEADSTLERSVRSFAAGANPGFGERGVGCNG